MAKMTKKEMFNEIKGIVSGLVIATEQKQGIVDFINHEIELLDKKSGSSKETKTQKVNASIKSAILEVLAEKETAVTITQMMEDERLCTYTEELKDGVNVVKMSNQKLSALVNQLVAANLVTRVEGDKKRTFFKIA